MDFASGFVEKISKTESPTLAEADESVIRELMGETISKPTPAMPKGGSKFSSSSGTTNPKMSGASFGARTAQVIIGKYGATDTAQFVPNMSSALQNLSFDQMEVLFLACKDMSIGLDYEENNARILATSSQVRDGVPEPTKVKPYRQKAAWAAALTEIVPILRKSGVPAEYISWGLLAQTPEFIATSKAIIENMFIHSHILGEQPLYSKMFFSTMNLNSFRVIISPRAVFSYSVVRILTILGIRAVFDKGKSTINFSGLTDVALTSMKEGFRGDKLMLDGKKMSMNEQLLRVVKEACSKAAWDVGSINTTTFKSIGILVRNCVNVRPHMVQQVPEDRKSNSPDKLKIDVLAECLKLYNLMVLSTFEKESSEYKIRTRFPDLRKEEGEDYHMGWKRYVGTVRALKAALGEERRGAITRGEGYYQRDLDLDEIANFISDDMF